MNHKRKAVAFAAATCLAIAGTIAVPPGPAAAMPVFDAKNYVQSLRVAARALEQINHQIASLQNEAAMLQNMALNLERIDFPELERVTGAMQRIDQLMGQAQGIDYRIDQLDQRIRDLFPGAVDHVLGRDQQMAQARARFDAAAAAYRRAMSVQAQVVENVREDADMLSGLVARSHGAVGGLQAQQAANQLLALSIKQQFQLQSLMAAEYRGAALERAGRVQAGEDGRAVTRRFLGTGRAYEPADR